MRSGDGESDVVTEKGIKGERQVWVQEDGQIEIDIWEDVSETILFQRTEFRRNHKIQNYNYKI